MTAEVDWDASSVLAVPGRPQFEGSLEQCVLRAISIDEKLRAGVHLRIAEEAGNPATVLVIGDIIRLAKMLLWRHSL
jgi:hypothetical protein